MSDDFNNFLESHLQEVFQDLSITGGQRFQVKYHSSELTESVVRAAIELADTTVDIAENTFEAYEAEESPLIIIKVVDDTEGELEDFEVSQGFATTLRDEIVSSADTADPKSVLFVMETRSSIDTLEASGDLSEVGMPLHPEDFYSRLLAAEGIDDNPAGRATLKALKEILEEESVDPEDEALLEALAGIRAALSEEDPKRLSKELSELPFFVEEDLLETEDFFDKQKRSVEELSDEISSILRENREHAKQIRAAFDPGNNPEKELEDAYEEDFVNKVIQSNAEGISHSEASKNRIDNSAETQDVQYEDVSIDAESVREVQDEDGDTYKHTAICVAEDGKIKLDISFSGDPSDIPIEVEPEEEEKTRKEVEGGILEIEFSELRGDVFFGKVSLYVGKKTTRGHATHQLFVSAVPSWFFKATRDVELEIDFEEEEFLSRREDPIILSRSEEIDEEPREEVLDEREQTVTFDDSIKLTPKFSTERITCYIAPGHDPEGTPMPISFLPESWEEELGAEIKFPVFISAIGENWGSEGILDNVRLTDSGILDIGSIRDSVRDEDLKLLQVEEKIIADGTPSPREVAGDELQSGKVIQKSNPDSMEQLLEAYSELFSHFEQENTTPSTDPWGSETQEKARKVVESYVDAVESLEQQMTMDSYTDLRDVGTIRSKSTSKVWLTPFHPLILAYCLRVCEWRDSEAELDDNAGFRSEKAYDYFSPLGLMPYRLGGREEYLQGGFEAQSNNLWLVYSESGSAGGVTPKFMDKAVKDKLIAFQNSFPVLFQLHEDRPIYLNLINLGDMEPVMEGLFDFYRHLEKQNKSLPPIRLQIYGDSAQAGKIERFFSDSANSDLRRRLEKKDQDIVTVLRKHVSYIRLGEHRSETQRFAHITFFQDVLKTQDTQIEVREMPSSMRRDGLFPQESLLVTPSREGSVHTTGFGCGQSDKLLHQVSRICNNLECGEKQGSYPLEEQSLVRRTSSKHRRDLDVLWDESLWAVHVRPNVGLNFYLSGDRTGEEEDLVMIQYSDTYQPSSPGFDVITTTTKQGSYVASLNEALEGVGMSDALDAQHVLSQLVAIDGEIALDIHRAEGNDSEELLGFIGALSVSRRILEAQLGEYVWIPLSWAALLRHDRAQRQGEESYFQPEKSEPSSDDLLFVGIPRDDTKDVVLWPVEAKGGTSQLKKGREQIQHARDHLEDLFDSDTNYADRDILYMLFGKVILDAAERMFYYDLLDEDDYKMIENWGRPLEDGEFGMHFLSDTQTNIGEVVRVKRNKISTDFKSKNRVRVWETGTGSLRLLNSDNIDDVLNPIDVEKLEFEDLSEGTAEGDQESDTSETGAVTLEEEEEMESGSEDEAREREVSETSESGGMKESPETDDVHADEALELVSDLQESGDRSTNIDVGRLVTDIKNGFEQLGISVKPPNPSSVTIGPRKIGVDVYPKEGQKIEKIINSLSSLSVHIKAQGEIIGKPKPSKGAVRLEIPHDAPSDVYLREGLEDLIKASGNNSEEALKVPLGVNVENEHHTLSLLDEKHALVGGATGSGKSNFLAAVISSLAILHEPEEVNVSILDPKGLDFRNFANIPHVGQSGYIDSARDCTDYLMNILEEELPERKEKLREAGAVSIQEYNEEKGDTIPYHVIVVDEFADLIMSLEGEKESFEKSVARLAQVGRALGYVLLIATQRPSAKVVSGNVKANLPCRISFRLPSGTDSRVILDKNGAEKLQGAGDMIAITNKEGEKHLQSYLLDKEDRHTIISRLGSDE